MPTTEPAVEREENPQRPPLAALVYNAVQLLESRNNTWSVVVPHGTSRADLHVPSLWATAGERFRQFDVLHIVEASRAYWCRALVTAAGRGYARIHILEFQPLEKVLTADGDGQLPAGFAIDYHGPETEHRYCATRVADGVIIVSGCASHAECLERLLMHATLRA